MTRDGEVILAIRRPSAKQTEVRKAVSRRRGLREDRGLSWIDVYMDKR